MAIGWISLIRSVPWDQVAKRAPEIADLAKKLWNTSYKSPKVETDTWANEQSSHQAGTNQSSFFGDDQRLVSLEKQLAVVEASSARQHRQLVEALELITDLAEQNTQLVKTIEINRIRIFRLTVFSVLIAIVSALSLYFSLR